MDSCGEKRSTLEITEVHMLKMKGPDCLILEITIVILTKCEFNQ